VKLRLFSKHGSEERKKKGKNSTGIILSLVDGGGDLFLKFFLAKTNLVVYLTETHPDNCNILHYIFKLCPVKPVYNLHLSHLWQSCLFTFWSVVFN